MLIPYSTERELQRMPYATISLIVVNVICAGVFWPQAELFQQLWLHPDELLWWQPITHMFMHGGLDHLGGNMLFLWLFGAHAEDVLGISKYLLLYFSGGLTAAALQIGSAFFFDTPLLPMLGASGAVMALVALFATRFRHVKISFFYFWYYRAGTFEMDAIWVAAFYFVMDLFTGFTFGLLQTSGGTAHFAHIGGFITGLGWAFGLRLPAQAHIERADAEMRQWATAGAYEAAGVAAEVEAIKHPNDPNLRWRAASYFEMKPLTRERAIPLYNEALRIWLDQGRHEEAFEHWDRLMSDHQLEQFDPEVMCDLAVARENAGQYQAATHLYSDIVQHHPRSRPAPLAALRLGQLLARMGQLDAASRWYHHVTRTWPDSQEALRARTELRRLSRD